MSGERREELAGRLAAVRERIAAAARAAGRDPSEVDLLADHQDRARRRRRHAHRPRAHRLRREPRAGGGREGRRGRRAPAGERSPGGTSSAGCSATRRGRWREWAARVESVDSVRLADALDSAARRAADRGRRSGPLPVLLQLSVDGDPARGGVPDDGLDALAEHVAGCSGLRLDGLMAVAPLGAGPGARIRGRRGGGAAGSGSSPGCHDAVGRHERGPGSGHPSRIRTWCVSERPLWGNGG